ncbi:hypothetical protein AMQ84_10825 [Paenibacillus riograndensis]|uniref:DUF4362 domain-containing protein n=1 Tax=Paenibacillus riograndensis TaxID=483937 RepID=A0A132U325_9BACL|nr:DUF4362 domain-containing protein [Paenibacillus riograndensis]KWX77964.1 hypothetical protein AMQ84_10825 [Paenibacillus riograndensis]KWX88796.1 hypothetical protein AMQ83_04495 [Paenibacillus riograndensis]
MCRIGKAGIVIIVMETFIIGILAGLLLVAAGKQETRDQPDLITHFDRMDLKRIEKMITGFSEGKGDKLTMLQWGIDSGPFIHDFYNDGREIHWTVDNTRDGMSANPGKTEYVCRAIGLAETADFYRVEVSDCDGYAKDEQISLISFNKDRL